MVATRGIYADVRGPCRGVRVGSRGGSDTRKLFCRIRGVIIGFNENGFGIVKVGWVLW